MWRTEYVSDAEVLDLRNLYDRFQIKILTDKGLFMNDMINNKIYPEVYFSTEILRILKSTPPLPNAPLKPQEPPKPKDPGEYDSGGTRGCFLFMLIGGIVLFLITIQSSDFSIGELLIALIVILITFFLFKTTSWDKNSHEQAKSQYEKDKLNYPTLMKQYEIKYQDYLKQKETHDIVIKVLLSPYHLAKYRSGQFISWKRNRPIPQFNPCDEFETAKKGVSEQYFANILSMRYKILLDQKVPVGAKYYYPDIIIVKDGLYIDIEIDEPYVGSDGSPIHYLEGKYSLFSVDEKRNDYMMNHGWEVIRFSEEQIFLHPKECLKIIDNFINAIQEGKSQFEIPSNMIVSKWTKEQAFKLAYQRFRKTYIPLIYQKYIDAEIPKSYIELRNGINNNR